MITLPSTILYSMIFGASEDDFVLPQTPFFGKADSSPSLSTALTL